MRISWTAWYSCWCASSLFFFFFFGVALPALPESGCMIRPNRDAERYLGQYLHEQQQTSVTISDVRPYNLEYSLGVTSIQSIQSLYTAEIYLFNTNSQTILLGSVEQLIYHVMYTPVNVDCCQQIPTYLGKQRFGNPMPTFL
ncbi:hypothetical protein DM02DRAFT_86792 [Periconia macrospinosa]|uniref:Uncharacterized protein n=1 Tax=Periconia macrospinosa TaxID=97972 RepID=A0A2V1DJH6_9PLEO|nr:hypothetical protein DM02DRAFT_86792 [Periconia macrospinosa]